jgi:hypothetical protein
MRRKVHRLLRGSKWASCDHSITETGRHTSFVYEYVALVEKLIDWPATSVH